MSVNNRNITKCSPCGMQIIGIAKEEESPMRMSSTDLDADGEVGLPSVLVVSALRWD